MYKVWYRNKTDQRLEVEVIGTRLWALRRAATIATERGDDKPVLVGIEDDDGGRVPMDEFDDYVRSYRADAPVPRSKYYVEVEPLESMRKAPEDDWVRWAIETTMIRANQKADEAREIFGYGRVRVVGVQASGLVRI